MVDAQGTAVEAALWTALEVLEERSELLRRIAKRMEHAAAHAARFASGAREAEERAAVIRRILHSGSVTQLIDEAWPDEHVPEDPAFEALLEFLKRSRGLDFTGYKRPSLQRRFRRRMETVGLQSFGDYLDYLEVHPDEYEQLFEMLLINVTEFFRDPASWEHLRDAVLPDLLAAKARRRAGAGVERGLRQRPGGLHGGDRLRRADGRRGVPRAGEDLRHRHRRGRAQPGAAGDLQRQGDRVAPGRAARALLRARRPEAGLPQGPPPDGHLRPQQPRGRRADLATGPADLPQHADVLQRRDPGPDPAPLPLRAARRRRADARQVGDDDLPPRPVRAGRPQEAHLRQAAADDRQLARRAPSSTARAPARPTTIA